MSSTFGEEILIPNISLPSTLTRCWRAFETLRTAAGRGGALVGGMHDPRNIPMSTGTLQRQPRERMEGANHLSVKGKRVSRLG